MTVYPDFTILINTIKVDKYQFILFIFLKFKRFAVPANSTGQCTTTRRCRIFIAELAFNAPIMGNIQGSPA